MISRSFSFLSSSILLTYGLLLPAPTRAAVVWTATFEKGDSSEWKPGINAVQPNGTRKNFEVLGEQVYRGKFAGKITVHPDDTFSADQIRVDIQHPSTLTDEGKNSWITGHYMLPADAGGREEFAFCESNGTSQNVLDFWFDAKQGGGTTINFGTGFLGQTKLWTADFSTGVWHQVALHVLWSTNAQTGTVDVWFDGVQVVTAAHSKTKADNNSLFFQTGLHRRKLYNVTTSDTLYFDDFIEADAMADAGIAVPTPDSGAGGMGGGAGMGGAAGAGGGSAASAGGGPSPLGGTGGTAGTTSGGTPNGGMTTGTGGTSTPTAGTGTTPVSTSSDSGGCSLGAAKASRETTTASLLTLLALGVCMSRRRARRLG